MEAAGSGLPLALSRIPGHQPLIDLSLQFDLKDLDQGARSVEELIVQIQESPQVFLDSLTKNCHTIRSTSTVDAMTARYEDVYLKASNS
jgi:hypothetical protein